MKNTSIITGLAIGSLLAMSGAQAGNPFHATSMATAHSNSSKAAEAKCGEGKCGADTVKKPTKKVDGKCGEGKCGGTK
ncbi:hypothetical protein [Psychrobacter sp.]|uniref:HvfA family oxazolone/thioamide-modified RiPP metallophore n=1 Tax=Psychrobacter sp. TaxID=56811 RepID=UPI0025E7803A|nr:hypothetical protein [Psychrobacter sp.]